MSRIIRTRSRSITITIPAWNEARKNNRPSIGRAEQVHENPGSRVTMTEIMTWGSSNDMNKLSNRSRNIFKAIIDYKRLHDGNSPTLRQIMAATGITSTAVMKHQMGILIKAELIRVAPDLHIRARSIEVVGGMWSYQSGTSERSGT